MKFQNSVTYLAISLALFFAMSLLGNVQAQTNSSVNQTSLQQQNLNITAQALIKTDIFGLKDTLEKAKFAIVDGNTKVALKDVRDVETQLLLTEPSPTKLLSKMHKAINAIARSDIDKSLNLLTDIQVSILKAENQIFKAMVANPQIMQQLVEQTNEDSK